ncbi:LOW QUALITY PROTEIN: cilium assembly protein DZIP1L [Chlamydotis macqueenii]
MAILEKGPEEAGKLLEQSGGESGSPDTSLLRVGLSLGASHLQTTFWGLKLGEKKKLILALFLLQTGSDNHCPYSSSELAGESLRKLVSCAIHVAIQRLPGFPEAGCPRPVSRRWPRAVREAQACAGRWAGWARCCCTQHTQQHANRSVPGPSASAGAPSASRNMPFPADVYHPLRQAAAMPGASPGLTIPADVPPFHFQPRRVGVDWRRFGAIDVERVAREVDLATLQEHIASVTFCNLDGERCPHCGQPADPVLLKVLRMAQLSIEYLLHCQECLGTSLALHAQHLQDAQAQLARAQQQVMEQAAQLRGAKEESRRWKKLMATQQLLLQAGPNAYRKCHLCNKAFMNDAFLQAHVQRRHAEATKAERQKMKQVEQMEGEVEELKAKLRETQQQLEAERQAEKLRREQETERARQREEEGRRDLERWQEEERRKLHEEIDGLRQLFLAAFKDVASRSSAIEGKLQELQAKEVTESNLGTLRDDDTEEARWQVPSWTELRGEQEKMAAQVSNGSRTLSAIPSQDRRAVVDHVHRQMDVLSTHLGEQPKVMKSQEKKIKLLSASKPEVTQEVTKVVADESADREEAAQGGKQRLLEALRRNPNLLKQFRPILEEVLEEKLESMGVKRVAKGISTRTYKSLQALVRLQQRQKAEKFPGLLSLRDKLVQAVMRKCRRCQKTSSAFPRQLSILPAQSLKSPRPLRGSQPVAIPAAGAAPRSRAHSTHRPPGTPWGALRTSKASSPLRASVPRWSPEAMLGGKKHALCSVKLSPQQELAVSAVVLGDETDSNGSDLDSLEEMAGSGTVISTMARILERHLDAAAQRPHSRVKLFPDQSSASPKKSQPAKKLQLAGDSSDLELSSLEDPAEPPLRAAAGARGAPSFRGAARGRGALAGP